MYFCYVFNRVLSHYSLIAIIDQVAINSMVINKLEVRVKNILYSDYKKQHNSIDMLRSSILVFGN